MGSLQPGSLRRHNRAAAAAPPAASLPAASLPHPLLPYCPLQVSTWERLERRREAGALLPLKSRIPSWMQLAVRCFVCLFVCLCLHRLFVFSALLCALVRTPAPLPPAPSLRLCGGLRSAAGFAPTSCGTMRRSHVPPLPPALPLPQSLGPKSASQTSLEGFDNDG